MPHLVDDPTAPHLTKAASGTLLGVGAATAVCLFFVALSITPPQYHYARDLELRAAYEVFDRTGVPLVKEKGTGSWYTQITDPPGDLVPAAWDDDPGSYLVALYLGRLLGDRDPYGALRLAMAFLVALPWLVLPLAVGRLSRRSATGAAVVAAPVLGLLLRGTRSLPGTDYGLPGGRGLGAAPVYALYGLAASWLFFGLVVLLLLATTRRRPLMDVGIVIACGLAAGAGNLLRSWSGAGLAAAAGVVVGLCAARRTRARVLIGLGAALAALIIGIGTQRAVMDVVDHRRAAATGVPNNELPDAHATWVPLYTGLGYEGHYDGYRTPNPFGVQWSDDYVLAKVRAVVPDVQFSSREFDQVAKQLYLEQVRTRPAAVALTYLKKLGDTLAQNVAVLAALAAMSAVAVWRRRARELAIAGVIAAPSIVYGLIPPTLVFPMRYYFVEFTAGSGLLIAVGVAVTLGALVSPRRRTRAGGPAGSMRPSAMGVEDDR